MKKSKHPSPKILETTKECLELSGFLNHVVNDMVFLEHEKAHYWATYHASKLKSELKVYHENIKNLPDFEEYEVTRKKMLKDGTFNLKNLEDQFPEFIKKKNSLQDEPLKFEIRPFLTDWAFEIGASRDISGILIEFDLLDDPEKLLDYIYSSDTVKKDEKKDKKSKK